LLTNQFQLKIGNLEINNNKTINKCKDNPGLSAIREKSYTLTMMNFHLHYVYSFSRQFNKKTKKPTKRKQQSNSS